MRRQFLGAAIVLLLSCASAFAQQTAGNITGRVLDQQGAAVPGVTVTAKSAQTGLTRTETTDAEGLYRLTALPVGVYDVTADLQGFTTVANKGVEVNVAQSTTLDFTMKIASDRSRRPRLRACWPSARSTIHRSVVPTRIHGGWYGPGPAQVICAAMADRPVTAAA